jgi:hypothetical protein
MVVPDNYSDGYADGYAAIHHRFCMLVYACGLL